MKQSMSTRLSPQENDMYAESYTSLILKTKNRMKKYSEKVFLKFKTHRPNQLLGYFGLWLVFLFSGTIQLHANENMQTAIIHIESQALTLGELISEIETQTDYLFIYSKNDIDTRQKVGIKTGDNQVGEVLQTALSNTDMTYVFANNYISLRKKAEKDPVNDTKREMSPTPAPAQSKTVTGTVIDEYGDPVIGANVIEKGTTNGVITNLDGSFSLQVSNNAILQISFIGYLPQEIAVGNQTTFNITLREDVKAIDEVIVVGYGVQRKVTATGSVSKVEGGELTKMSTVNVSKALQGLSPGITIIDRGGAPGNDDPQIYLRGVGTTGNTSPLILIDGIEGSLSQVPSQEIESISVLKDAASASIYGSRAAHGVILVTTKRGKSGKAKISYNGYVGLQDMAVRPKQVNAREYLEMVNEASLNRGGTPLYSDEAIEKIVSGSDPNYPYMNYIDEIFQKEYLTEHTLSITGGNETARYATMFNFLDQPGIIENTKYKRYTYRANLDLNINKYLRISSDLSYRHADRVYPTQLGTAQYRAFSMQSTVPIKWANGNYALDDQQTNPVASTDYDVVGKQDFQRDNFIGQVKVDLEPIKDLIFTGSVGINAIWTREKGHNKNYKFYDANNNYVTQWNAQNGVYDSRNNRYQLSLRFLANYTKTFADDHSIHVLYGMEQESYRNYWSQAERRNLVSDALPDVSLGSASNQYAYGEPEAWGINSFFGRINYGYKDRYLLEANIRTDGSSRFAQGNKWGVFPSVSGAWRISEEAFMEDVNFIDNLKLRLSWGQTGNERIPTEIGRFLYLPQYGTENVVMDGSLVTGVYQKKMANPALTWETVESTDIGLDFAFLNNRIFGELDFYIKDTKDILLSLAIPKFIGLDPPHQNVGVVRNKGFETMLGYRKTSGDFKYSISGNLSYNKNEWIDRLGDDDNIHSSWHIERSGYALKAFYIYKADGLIANQQELDEYKAKHTADPRGIDVLKPGDVKLVDVNGDGKITPDDRQVYSSDVPKLTYGVTINAEYKGFDISLLLQGTSGANRFFYGELFEGPSYEAFTGIHFRKRWTEQNQNGDAEVPRIESANNRNMSSYNSFYLRDISYLRLKNAQIGYTFPRNITSKLMVENLRLYVSGSNLLTFSGLHQGIDPESNSGRPTDFPPIKIFSFGVSVTF